MYNVFFKRLIDVVISLIALIILSPIILVIILLLAIINRGHVFFFQERPGLNEVPFKLFKFKTMNDRTNINGVLLPDKQRITSIGRLLRKTSLDELPELANILIGHMSLVGPRPLLMNYLPYYTNIEKIRHNVKPGLTGLAQINGRNAISWETKLALDVEYVNNISFILDIRILFKTVVIIFKSNQVLDSAPQGSLDSYRKNHLTH